MTRLTDEKLAIISKVGDSDAQAMASELQERRKLEVRPDEFYMMLMCSVRYALGRSTYVVQEVADLVKKYGPLLSLSQRSRLLADVREKLEQARVWSGAIGEEVDHRIWQNLVDFLDQLPGGANAQGG